MARGGAMVSSTGKVCGFAIHTRTHGQRLWIFPPWDQVSKMCVYRRCVYIHVDDRPKRCKTYAFKHRSISTRMAPQCPRIHHSSHLGAKFSFELLLVKVTDPPLTRQSEVQRSSLFLLSHSTPSTPLTALPALKISSSGLTAAESCKLRLQQRKELLLTAAPRGPANIPDQYQLT